MIPKNDSYSNVLAQWGHIIITLAMPAVCSIVCASYFIPPLPGAHVMQTSQYMQSASGQDSDSETVLLC